MTNHDLQVPALTEPWRKYDILIVDDEPSVIRTISKILSAQGFKVTTAGSAEEGLQLLKTLPAKLIVSDQKMPGGMSGTQFLLRVKEEYPHVVRMILSAYTESEHILEAMHEARTYYYMSKPWEDHDLIRHVTQALKHYHAEALEREHNEKMTAALIQSEKMATLSIYGTSIAHNIRNMMLPSVANNDVIRQDLTEIYSIQDIEERNALLEKYAEEMFEALDSSDRAVSDVNELVETILSFYRADQKESQLYDLLPQVETAIKFEKMRRKLDQITTHFETKGQDFTIEALKGFVNSNIVEFLKNAGDAIADKCKRAGEKVKGNIWVTLEDTKHDRLGDVIRITFKDDGCGIPAEIQKEIFAPMFTTKAAVGTGFGLYAVAKMVEQHKGTIEVNSKVGEGTEFILTLPKRQNGKVVFDVNRD